MSTRMSAATVGRTGRRVTISDVASALDLTKSTVSRALNGYADISPATRRRVEVMARQMNYQPLSYAQAVRTGRTRSLGFVLQLSDHDAMRPFLAEFLDGMSAGASADGYTLTVASARDDDQLIETFRGLSRDGKADGFILPRVLVNDPRVEEMRRLEIPFVIYGRKTDPADCAWFDIRGEEAMATSVARLAELGHRRIAFINSGPVYEYARIRREGFMAGVAKAGLAPEDCPTVEDAVTREMGEAAAMNLLSSDKPPTAIVCAVDRVALGVYGAAAKLGLAIGRDLSVVGYDGIPDGAHVTPPLTTFLVDNREAGQRLASLLIRRIRGESPDDLRETTMATFVDRGSMGPPAPINTTSPKGER